MAGPKKIVLDSSEIRFGENTDLGVGAFGAGFAHNYEEVRQGNYFREESFDGHGGGANISLYQLSNPGADVPLTGVLRATAEYRAFTALRKVMIPLKIWTFPMAFCGEERKLKREQPSACNS